MQDSKIKFEFYVLNGDFNSKEVKPFNVFRNYSVNEWTLKTVRKYLRSPKKFKYEGYKTGGETIYGFEAFCKEIESILFWQECGRVEYEISVGPYPFYTEEDVKDFKYNRKPDKLQRFDCYMQCKPNIKIICHDILRQYREFVKAEKGNKGESTTL